MRYSVLYLSDRQHRNLYFVGQGWLEIQPQRVVLGGRRLPEKKQAGCLLALDTCCSTCCTWTCCLGLFYWPISLVYIAVAYALFATRQQVEVELARISHIEHEEHTVRFVVSDPQQPDSAMRLKLNSEREATKLAQRLSSLLRPAAQS